jgi:carbon monoxide dehydrogenase subunit G
VKVKGVKEFDASPQLVWDVLNNPSKMAKLLPGVESFEVQGDRHWSASVKIPLGMGGLALKFNFERLEELAARVRAPVREGTGRRRDRRHGHTVPPGARRREDVDALGADVRVAGPIGSVGQRVFQPIVNRQVGNVLNALEAQIAEAKAAG